MGMDPLLFSQLMQSMVGNTSSSLGALSMAFPRFDNNYSGAEAVIQQGQGLTAAAQQNMQTIQEEKKRKKAEKKNSGFWNKAAEVGGGIVGGIVGGPAGVVVGSQVGGGVADLAQGQDFEEVLKNRGVNSIVGYGTGKLGEAFHGTEGMTMKERAGNLVGRPPMKEKMTWTMEPVATTPNVDDLYYNELKRSGYGMGW